MNNECVRAGTHTGLRHEWVIKLPFNEAPVVLCEGHAAELPMPPLPIAVGGNGCGCRICQEN